MEAVQALTQFLTVLEANHFAAMALITLVVLYRRPPKN
jgi:hypothetical protein